MLQLDGFPTGDGVKADRSAGRLTGSMMELQTLQEALKVEIQIHQKLVAQMKQDPQNADLKKQLHELQAKITALSEKQKKVVEQLRKELLVKQEPEPKLQVQSGTITAEVKPAALLQTAQVTAGITQTLTVTPVLTAKTLPLVLKAAAAPTLTGPVLSQRPATVTMVTTAITKPDQNTPINLQVASKLTNQSGEPVRLVTKNAMLVQATTTNAQPIKVPQFVPPPRLTPRPTYQPQVRPKPVTPTNVPIAPAPPPPMMAAPQLLQRPVMLATKLATSLPSAAPIHQVRIVNGQPCAKTGTTPLTGIVITTPVSATATRLASPAHTPTPVPTNAQAIQISSIATEPKQTVKAVSAAEPKVITPVPSSATPPPSPAPRPKREENPEKLAFMVSLGLVTHDHLEEIQSKRQERKRRTTANPVYSGAVFEPERKKSAVSYLNSPLHQGTRKRGRPPKYSSGVPERGSLTPNSPSSPVRPLPLPSPSSADGDIHEDFCTVCRRSGQLLMCDTCSRVYHLDCLDPPLKTIPKGMWICPKCQDQILKKEEAIPWPGTLAIVHSYIAYKEAKEEEKQKLMKWSSELKLEREQLEQKVKQLSNSITKCMETKNSILARQKEMQHSLDKVKHLIRLIQAFNFNKAQKEPKEDTPKVQDSVTVQALPKPEANSVDKVSTDSNVSKSEEKHNATSNSVLSGEVRDVKEVTQATEGTEQANSVPSAANTELQQTGEVSNAGTTTETQPTADTEAPAGGKITPSEPTPPITTNGTSEPACPEHSPTGNTTSPPYSENKMAAAVVISAETNQEAPNNNNNNNSKTSASSQHCLPALVSSSDTDK